MYGFLKEFVILPKENNRKTTATALGSKKLKDKMGASGSACDPRHSGGREQDHQPVQSQPQKNSSQNPILQKQVRKRG
jgi:hypothetical protein